MVNTEGHGREGIIEDTDISRTVGWFTSCYPVILEGCSSEDIPKAIKTTKESIRKIPNKGIGHDILRYLSPEQNINELSFEKQAEINFNYLGQFGQDIENNIFSISQMPIGQSIHPDSELLYKLDINGLVAQDKLEMTFTYNSKQYKREIIKRLTDIYKKTLTKVIDYCLLKEETEHTSSDYGDLRLGFEELSYNFV